MTGLAQASRDPALDHDWWFSGFYAESTVTGFKLIRVYLPPLQPAPRLPGDWHWDSLTRSARHFHSLSGPGFDLEFARRRPHWHSNSVDLLASVGARGLPRLARRVYRLLATIMIMFTSLTCRSLSLHTDSALSHGARPLAP